MIWLVVMFIFKLKPMTDFSDYDWVDKILMTDDSLLNESLFNNLDELTEPDITDNITMSEVSGIGLIQTNNTGKFTGMCK